MYEYYIPDALDFVAGWDLDDETFAKAVNDQAKLMSGLELSDFYEADPEQFCTVR